MGFKKLMVSKLLKGLSLLTLAVTVVGCYPTNTEAKQSNNNKLATISEAKAKDKDNGMSLSNYTTEKVILDNGIIELNTLLKDNRKYIPLRQLSDNLGYSVAFDNKSKIITVKSSKDSKGIKLGVSSNNIILEDGSTLKTDVSPFILPDTSTTYVPIRVVNEAFGFTVDASGNFLVILTNNTNNNSSNNVNVNALSDKLMIDKFMVDYRTLLDEFKHISSNAELSTQQDNLAYFGNLKNNSSAMLVCLNMYKFKTTELDTTKIMNEFITGNKRIISFCDKILNDKSEDSFDYQEFVSELIDLEVSYLTVEREQVKLSSILDAIVGGVKPNENSDKK